MSTKFWSRLELNTVWTRRSQSGFSGLRWREHDW